MAGLPFRQLQKVQADSHLLLNEQAERLALAQEWRENILVNSQRALAIGVTGDERLASFFKDVVKAATTRTSDIQKRYAEMETSAEGQQLQARLGEARKRYLTERDAVMKAQGEADARLAAGEKFRDVTNAYIAEATEMLKFQQGRSALLDQQIDAELVAARTTLWGVTAVCALLAAALGWSQARSITAPLGRLQDAAQRIAQGDLSHEVPTMAGRPADARRGADADCTASLGQSGPPGHGFHRGGQPRSGRRQQRPERPHRTGCLQPGGECQLDGGAHRHRQAHRRGRPDRQPPGRWC